MIVAWSTSASSPGCFCCGAVLMQHSFSGLCGLRVTLPPAGPPPDGAGTESPWLFPGLWNSHHKQRFWCWSMMRLEHENVLFSVLLHSCWRHSVISLTAYCTHTLINFSFIFLPFLLCSTCLSVLLWKRWRPGSISLPWFHSQENRDGKCIFVFHGRKMMCWCHVHRELQATLNRKRRLWALVNTT